MGTNFFSRGYFVGIIFFVVSILWVQIFSRGSKIISRGYFVDSGLFLMGVLQVQTFFLVDIRRVTREFICEKYE